MQIMSKNFIKLKDFDFNKATIRSAVYIITDNNIDKFEPIYIGIANNLKQRIKQHIQSGKIQDITGLSLYYWEFNYNSRAEAENFEIELTNYYKPSLNIHVPKKYLKTITNYYNSEQRAYIELDSAKKLFHEIIENNTTDENTNLIIKGAAGSGKTTMLDQLALKLANEKIGIPIFVSLRNYTSTLLDLINRSTSRFESSFYFEDLAIFQNKNEPAFWLLLDGLDEVAPSLHDQLISELKLLFNSNNVLNIVITTREYYTFDKIFEEWDIKEIKSLTKEEVVNYIGTSLNKKQIEILLSRKDLYSVTHSPLMLSTILQAYKNKKLKEEYIQKEIAQYQVWRGHTKSFLSPEISSDILNNILELIALDCILNEQVWIDSDKVKSLIMTEIDSDSNFVFEALINMDPIQVDDKMLRFRHKSYQTSYCARLLIKKLNNIESFIISVKAIFAKFNGPQVIEDTFLEATIGQKKTILSHLPNNILDYLNKSIPDDINNIIKHELENDNYKNNPISLFETAQSSLKRNEQRRRKIIVFAIHGFNTRGEWKNDLSPILGQETDGEHYIFHPWDYGSFVLGILNPFSRNKKIHEFHSFYTQTLDKYKDRPEVCVIGHSFGTYILGNAIMRFPEIEFDRIILLGSVLKNNFPWDKFNNRIKKVLNILGGGDKALLFASFVYGLGTAGRHGFINKPEYLYEHKEEFSDHSDLFGSNYIKRIWIPFIRNGTTPKNIE